MKKTSLILFASTLFCQPIVAQTWTKVTSIADSFDIKAVAKIDDRILISGPIKGTSTTYHFSSPDGNTDWNKLPTFSFAGNYLFGMPVNGFLLGGGFLDCKKLECNSWATSFGGSGFAEFPDGTIIGGSANYPDSVYTYSTTGVRGKTIGKFNFKFGPKYTVANNGRLFLYVYGSGFAYIDQSDKSKLVFPAMLDGNPMTESSWNTIYIISDLAKLSDGTLIATNKANTIIRSTDNGDSWTTVLNKNSAVGLAVEVNSKDEVFVIFEAKVLKSIDGGLNYTDVSSNLPPLKVDLFINSKDELFVVCNANGAVNTSQSGVYKYNDPATGVFTQNEKTSTIMLYPNPTDKEINIEINEEFEHAQLIINNTNGQEVSNNILSENQSRIDLSHLPKGLYFAQITINGKTETQKLIVK
jgi:hypothetical protein